MSIDTIGKAEAISESAVVITGGTSGVGLATALEFAAQGCKRIALIGRDKERGEHARSQVLVTNPGIQVEFFSADAHEHVQAKDAAEKAYKALGAIDVLVNSTSAPYVPSLLFNTPVEDICGILTGQALPQILMSRIVLPWMREQKSGVIINIASDAAKVPTPGESVIGASMAAIVVFTRTLAIEAKRDGIRANVMTPSLIGGTPLYDRIMADPFSAKLFNSAAKLANLGVAQPEDLAGLIVFLCGPGGARLTGQAISLNGGISAA